MGIPHIIVVRTLQDKGAGKIGIRFQKWIFIPFRPRRFSVFRGRIDDRVFPTIEVFVPQLRQTHPLDRITSRHVAGPRAEISDQSRLLQCFFNVGIKEPVLAFFARDSLRVLHHGIPTDDRFLVGTVFPAEENIRRRCENAEGHALWYTRFYFPPFNQLFNPGSLPCKSQHTVGAARRMLQRFQFFQFSGAAEPDFGNAHIIIAVV
jgi:hypothetical protein